MGDASVSSKSCMFDFLFACPITRAGIKVSSLPGLASTPRQSDLSFPDPQLEGQLTGTGAVELMHVRPAVRVDVTAEHQQLGK